MVTLTGLRQSGKTTFARAVFDHHAYASLEAPDLRQAANEDPRSFLARFPDGAALDEVQRCPEILYYLQTLVDKDGRMGLFIFTGSQQFGLMSGIPQSLAGRDSCWRCLSWRLNGVSHPIPQNHGYLSWKPVIWSFFCAPITSV
jgi:predicted AAA+ superfamily ATPase